MKQNNEKTKKQVYMASFLKKTLKRKVQKLAIFGLGFYLVGLQGFHAAGQFFGNRKNWPVTVAAFGGFGFLLYNQMKVILVTLGCFVLVLVVFVVAVGLMLPEQGYDGEFHWDPSDEDLDD